MCALTRTLILSLFISTLALEEYNSNDPLILTSYIENQEWKQARELSKVNPEKFLGVTSYTGFMTVKKEYNSNLFFWYFPVTEGDPEKTPLVIWLNGGPGYSSLTGVFKSTGPWQISDGKLKLRELTWVDSYSMLYIDNPVGAGFSFTDDPAGYPNNEDDVGDQLYSCLQQFLQMFPELRSAPLFVAGQSYAGKYVPALAIQIHRRAEGDKPVNLRGIAIGNGLIEVGQMMCHSVLCQQLGLLDGSELKRLKDMEARVPSLLRKGRMIDAANAFNESIEFIKKHSGVSIYDFTKDPSLKPVEFEHFVQRSEVRSLIHVGQRPFNLNNQHVYEVMLKDFANSSRPFIEELLDHYGVLGYSGQNDVILPYVASKRVYEAFNWSRRHEYRAATRRPVRDETGKVIAYTRAGGNFVEALVRGAGHDVAAAPHAFKWLIDTFISVFKNVNQSVKHNDI